MYYERETILYGCLVVTTEQSVVYDKPQKCAKCVREIVHSTDAGFFIDHFYNARCGGGRYPTPNFKVYCVKRFEVF